MQVGARTLREPAADELGFVRAVVVQDEVHVEFSGHVALDDIEKAAELARSDADDAVALARGRWLR